MLQALCPNCGMVTYRTEITLTKVHLVVWLNMVTTLWLTVDLPYLLSSAYKMWCRFTYSSLFTGQKATHWAYRESEMAVCSLYSFGTLIWKNQRNSSNNVSSTSKWYSVCSTVTNAQPKLINNWKVFIKLLGLFFLLQVIIDGCVHNNLFFTGSERYYFISICIWWFSK